MPGEIDRYYVFSMRYIGEMYGLDYAIVDMTGDSNRGEVIERGQNLREGITEKMTFVQQTESSNVWLIVHDFGSDEYVVFLISEAGISEATIYATGITHFERYGYLQPSPDGSILAAAVRTGFHSDGFVEVSRFDPANGSISESFELEMPNRPYGICFSPDNSKLYVTSGSPNHLFQFDLRPRVPELIQESRVQITSSPFINYAGSAAALQLASNGKIYLALYETNFLSVINQPNASGTDCDYVQNAVSLDGTGSCEGGLPNFGNLFWDQTPAHILDEPEPEVVLPEYGCEDLLLKSNPTNGAFVLESLGNEISSVVVYDISGRLVIPKRLFNSHDVRIDDTQHLADGAYVLRVTHGECLNKKKVILTR
jgi:WD40 repeat protein